MSFRCKLRALRAQAGLSQAALAAKAGLSLRSMQNWEQGHRGPSAQAVLALAQALHVSAELLLTTLDQDGEPGKKALARERPRHGQ